MELPGPVIVSIPVKNFGVMRGGLAGPRLWFEWWQSTWALYAGLVGFLWVNVMAISGSTGRRL